MSVLRALVSFEAMFLLFLLAGTYKDTGLVALLPIDATVLFFLLSMVAGGIVILRRGGVDRLVMPAVAVLLLIDALMLASLLYTPAPQYGLEKTMRFLVITGWSFLGPLLVVDSERRLRRFLLGIVAFGLFLSAGAGWALLSGVAPLGVLVAFSTRYTMLSRLTGTALLICIAFATHTRRWTHRLAWDGVAVVLFVVTFGAGGRAPLVAVGFPLALLILSSLRVEPGRLGVRNWSPMLVAEAIAGVLVIAYGFSAGLFDTVLNKIFGPQVRLGELRPELLRLALDTWVDHPVFGSGIGGYAMYLDPYDRVGYPHSLFPEVAAELGVVGLAMFLALFAIPFILLHVRRVPLLGRPVRLGVLLIFGNAFLSSMVAGDLNDNRALFFALALVMTLPVVARGDGDASTDPDDPDADRPQPELVPASTSAEKSFGSYG